MPFLIGVVLLFVGYNSLRNLAVLYPVGVEINEVTKELDSVYYEVPNYQVVDINGNTITPFYLDSIEYMITFLDVNEMAKSQEQIVYMDYLQERHDGINCVVVWNNNNAHSFLIEDDYKLLERNKRLHYVFEDEKGIEKIKSLYYPKGEVLGKYTLVDRNKHIRVHLDMNEAKDAKTEVLNVVKLLDKEFYKNERIKVEQKKDNK